MEVLFFSRPLNLSRAGREEGASKCDEKLDNPPHPTVYRKPNTNVQSREQRTQEVQMQRHIIHVASKSEISTQQTQSSITQDGQPEQILERKAKAKRDIKDMIWYAIFLFMFAVATISGNSEQDIYFAQESLQKQLDGTPWPPEATHVMRTFKDVSNIDEIYKYIYGVFYPVIYTGQSFNGTYLPGVMLGQQILLGGIRIGTLRVKPVRCGIKQQSKFKFHDIKNSPEWCLPDWDPNTNSRDDYGRNKVYKSNPVEMDTSFRSSLTLDVYSRPMYNIFLNRVESKNCTAVNLLRDANSIAKHCEVAQTLLSLQQNGFVDIATRSVFIDINSYHDRLKRVIAVRITFEILQSGTILPAIRTDIFQHDPYQTTGDYFKLVTEFFVFIQVLIYIYQEILVIIDKRILIYIQNIQNFPHIVNLLLFLVVYGLRIFAYANRIQNVYVDGNDYINCRYYNEIYKLAMSLNSFNMFLSWVKVFKYLAFISQFSQLTRTLTGAASNLGGFFFIVLLTIFGSAQAFLLSFGANIYGYRNMSESFFTLVRALLMEYDLTTIRKVNPYWGPLIFLSFITLAVFVLLNMFIAIIGDAYTETREFLRQQRHHDNMYMRVFFDEIIYKIPYIGSKIQNLVLITQSRIDKLKETRKHFSLKMTSLLSKSKNQRLLTSKIQNSSLLLAPMASGNVDIERVLPSELLKQPSQDISECSKTQVQDISPLKPNFRSKSFLSMKQKELPELINKAQSQVPSNYTEKVFQSRPSSPSTMRCSKCNQLDNLSSEDQIQQSICLLFSVFNSIGAGSGASRKQFEQESCANLLSDGELQNNEGQHNVITDIKVYQLLDLIKLGHMAKVLVDYYKERVSGGLSDSNQTTLASTFALDDSQVIEQF